MSFISKVYENKLLMRLASVMTLWCASNCVLAQTAAGPLNIVSIRTGWAEDSFAILSAAAPVNPANCATPDGYTSSVAHPGYKTHYAAALTAFAMSKQVYIVVSNTTCYLGRPVIWSIQLV